MPSAKTVVPETFVEDTSVDERTDLPEQWLELAKVSQRTAIETVRRFLETAESMPLVGTGLSITERLAHMEYDALRSIVHSAADVDVNVGVNVDVLSKGLHVDVLSKGVNVNVLSREATP
ncbi:MAG: hypothetical protein ACLPUT_00995 [Solirubrobacteraceae bacterium]